MTKVQEEAIERLKEDVKYSDLADTLDEDCTICFIEDVETVLHLLETKQNRIQELEKALIDDDYKYKVEIEKKDKMINKMADLLNSGLREGLYINAEVGSIGFCMCSSKEEIKQYFENQAKM